MSPYTGFVYTVGAIPRSMLVAHPELLPMFGFLAYVRAVKYSDDERLTDAEREALRRETLRYEDGKAELGRQWATIADDVIRSFLREVRNREGELLDVETVAATMPEFEVRWILPTVRDLSSGLTALEREKAATDAASFRGEPDGEATPEAGGATGDVAVGGRGGTPAVPGAHA